MRHGGILESAIVPIMGMGFGKIMNACGHLDLCVRVRGARRGIRTPTVARWILSPVRLPVPPFSLDGSIFLMRLSFLTGHHVKCQGKRGKGEMPRCHEDHLGVVLQGSLLAPHPLVRSPPYPISFRPESLRDFGLDVLVRIDRERLRVSSHQFGPVRTWEAGNSRAGASAAGSGSEEPA
jgi:hypothetical protein